MTKTLAVLAAASTLTLSAALAQQTANPPASPPAATAPSASNTSKATEANKSAEMNKAPAANASNTAPAATAAVTTQKPDEFLASKFKGTNVVGTDDKKIGDVTDLLFDKSGSIKAVIVGVGGFLGIGSKDVALTLDQFQVVSGKDGSPDQLRLAMTKDQLASTAEFKPYAPPRPAVPGPGGMRPATAPIQNRM